MISVWVRRAGIPVGSPPAGCSSTTRKAPTPPPAVRAGKLCKEKKIAAESSKGTALDSVLVAAILAIALSQSAEGRLWAHHSSGSQFDPERPVTVSGEVARVEWVNPHVYLHLDVAGDAGRPTRWLVELGSPNALRRLGWGVDRIRPGDRLRIEGLMGRDQGDFVGATAVVLSDTGESVPVSQPGP